MTRFDCTIYDMPQRSEAWFDIRKGKLTASQAGEWLAERPECRLTIAELREMAKEAEIHLPKTIKRPEIMAMMNADCLPKTLTKKTIDARDTAINKCLGDLATLSGPEGFNIDPDGPPPRNPALWAVWNGIRLEDEAREALERHMTVEIEEVGFCEHKGKAVGCSPDGLVKGQHEGVEIKCPLAATHVGYLRTRELPSTYRAQVHLSLAVTGATAWHFWSYCPGLPPFYHKTEREEYTEQVLAGIEDFTEELSEARKEMKNLWDTTFTEQSGGIE